MTRNQTVPAPESTVERFARVRAEVAAGHAARLLPDNRDAHRPHPRQDAQDRFDTVGLPRLGWVPA